MNPTELWNVLKDALLTFGFTKGLILVMFLGGHYWVFRLYENRVKDRQREIDNLARDNREYRDRFLTILDRHFELPSKGEPKELYETAKGRKLKQGDQEQN